MVHEQRGAGRHHGLWSLQLALTWKVYCSADPTSLEACPAQARDISVLCGGDCSAGYSSRHVTSIPVMKSSQSHCSLGSCCWSCSTSYCARLPNRGCAAWHHVVVSSLHCLLLVSSANCTGACGNLFVGNNLSDKPVLASSAADRGHKHVQVQPLLFLVRFPEQLVLAIVCNWNDEDDNDGHCCAPGRCLEDQNRGHLDCANFAAVAGANVATASAHIVVALFVRYFVSDVCSLVLCCALLARLSCAFRDVGTSKLA
jgi:hypothetical protein